MCPLGRLLGSRSSQGSALQRLAAPSRVALGEEESRRREMGRWTTRLNLEMSKGPYEVLPACVEGTEGTECPGGGVGGGRVE